MKVRCQITAAIFGNLRIRFSCLGREIGLRKILFPVDAIVLTLFSQTYHLFTDTGSQFFFPR